MAVFFLVLGIVVSAIYFSAVLSERRLLSLGVSAEAIVRQCQPGQRGRKSGYYLYYEYLMPDGSKKQGKEFRGRPMAEGTAVTILFAAQQPQRSRIYPIPLVRLHTP